jgi:hypothetical protein
MLHPLRFIQPLADPVGLIHSSNSMAKRKSMRTGPTTEGSAIGHCSCLLVAMAILRMAC